MEISIPEMVVVAVLIGHIAFDDPALLGGDKHHVGFDHPGGMNDHPGTNPAVMTDAAPQHFSIGETERAAPINGPDRCGD